jgi:hypothetical protein
MTVVEFANLVLRAQEASDASVDTLTEELGIWPDEAFVQKGGDPAMQPLVEMLFKGSEAEFLAWARQTAEA